MAIPKNLPKPIFVRPNDYVTLMGADYIIKRNEFAQMVHVVGRVSRRLPSEKDVIWALTAHRKVGYWGSKYFLYERIDQEVLAGIKEAIWEADKRRGIPKPDIEEIEGSMLTM
ncbi:MAG: hypothetical protein HN356_02795 [Calditrichaeota bacterium]|jgi:hypothetical protein|nr:hypothetical protein [Calditrichota bacterium]MBT7788537.1 hypothetical protein [Calditrichota bacterium]